MERIDVYPIKTIQGYQLGIGRPLPFGATIINGGVNFSVYSMHADGCTLVLFKKGEKKPLVEIPLTDEFRIGNVYCVVVFGINYETTEYAYRFSGKWEPRQGLCYDSSKLLLDPYAKMIVGMEKWGRRSPGEENSYRGGIIAEDFDWRGDRPLYLPAQEMIIYECHVRGFTVHPSSGVRYPGTFSGLREKIPYLKKLGINAVELMPIYSFDEMGRDAGGNEKVVNYWGYNPIAFFSPKTSYAVRGNADLVADELKNLIRSMHSAGIEVILDVVFNHTAEGGDGGSFISFKGIDNKDYYLLNPDGTYCNYSGCGNTLNCNHPVVRGMIIDCLRYWAADFHIDGFRFDLAAIMTRDENGNPMIDPPLLQSLAYDPILNRCKLIAEAWDAGGLYQVGDFPKEGHFSEWNGKYRDTIRSFLKGDEKKTGEAVTRILGSSDLYSDQNENVLSSVNFITCHDGFTMMDLVSYNEKHNEANGEENRDGSNDNLSWNCGAEGKTRNREILALRKRQIRNAFTILLMSQGIPMILAGDEFGNSQEGNNNAYCQDSPVSWLDWELMKTNEDLLDYAEKLIAFRKAHPVLRRTHHFTGEDPDHCGIPDVSMHGLQPDCPDYESRMIAILYNGHYTENGEKDDDILFVMNMHWEAHTFQLPLYGKKKKWKVVFNTGTGKLTAGNMDMTERSVAVLI